MYLDGLLVCLCWFRSFIVLLCVVCGYCNGCTLLICGFVCGFFGFVVLLCLLAIAVRVVFLVVPRLSFAGRVPCEFVVLFALFPWSIVL